jgi:ligand-binding sensor domain-containing protein/serine phosphatase RsbU (regulator of sigma subunit)
VSSVDAFLNEPGVKWVGSLGAGTGLKRTNLKTGETTQFKHDPSDPFSISSDKVYSVYRDRSGILWVGTYNGLDKLDEKSGKFTHYRNNPADPNSLSDNWVWPIYEDSKGNLWVGTVNGGLNKFNRPTNSFSHFVNDPSNPSSLNDNYIFSIYEDRAGLIWIGTNAGGINYFMSSLNVFEHYVNKPEDRNSLSDNAVVSIMVDRVGTYWIGTRNGGLDKFDYKKKKFINYSHNPANTNSILSNSIVEIYEDRSGILWLGTFSSGLSSFDPNSGNFKHYVNNPSDPYSLTDNRVYSILEDSDGMIWIGTYAGGLNLLDRKTGRISNYKFDKDDSTSLSSNSVWSMLEDNSGELWLGTFGGGVSIFNRKLKKFTHLKNNPDNPASLLDNNIITLFMDSRGNMWFGTTKGLSCYVHEKNYFKNYTEESGLANNFIFGILEDGRGNIWLSTNNGLSKFNPESESFTNYYAADGLQSNEFNQNAYAKDNKSGRLLFGGINGLNVFHPDSIKGNTFVPPVVFTNYLRYNTDDEEGKPIFEKGISVRDSISLTFKDNIVTLQFSALSYYNNSENQYKYMLEGFNENWIQLGNDHTITFTNLSPDDYVLRVIGSNNDGIWNEKGASLFVEVLPPWWRTNFAYAAYVILFLGTLYGLRRFEINRREQKTRMRENELRLKATEAEKRAIEIENERKTKELEEARELQLSMLPRELPKLPHLEIAAFMKTATEVGGDYYDFIVQENGVLNVAFGDATGHGLQAGTMVTLMKGFFTSDAAKLGLQEFMSHCTAMIKEIKLGRILMSFSLLKIDDSKLLITSAGMPPIYYFDNEKQDVEEITIQGMPLGAMRKFSYKVVEKEIKSGDILLLLSDGLPEQMNMNEEMFGYPRVSDRFKKFVNDSPENIIQNLIKSGEDWMGGATQQDDISFVVIKIK